MHSIASCKVIEACLNAPKHVKELYVYITGFHTVGINMQMLSYCATNTIYNTVVSRKYAHER